MRMKVLFASMLLAASGQMLAQTPGTVGGQVFDENGEPVIGAQVTVKGTKTGTATDVDGKFNLPSVKRGDIIVINYLGMESQTVKAAPGMKVTLHSLDQQLDEVIVVAYGEQKKSSFTGSAGVVDSKSLEKRQVNNVMDALQGNVAGLQSFQSSGSPDATPTFRIRGFSSLNAGNDPLIVLDGVPYDGLWSSINPADVASITVLKDAASNALYGARGANGVIIVTTKKGSQGKATVTLDAKLGWSSRSSKRYDTIDDPAEYLETHYKSLYNYYSNAKGLNAYQAHVSANDAMYGKTAGGGLGYVPYSVPDGQYLIGTNGKLNPNATLGNRVYNNGQVYTIMPDDWIDETYRTALRQEYNLSINGGNEQGQFYASLGYLNNEGIVIGSDYERYTARMKASYKANKWLTVGGNINYAHSVTNNADEDATGSNNIFYQAAMMAPIYPVYLRDGEGNILHNENGVVGDYGDGVYLGSNYVRPYISQSNGITDSGLNTQNTVSNSFTLNGYADVSIWDGLSATLSGNVYSNSNRYTQTINPFYGYGYLSFPNGYVYKTNYNYNSVNFQELLKYAHSFGKHNVSLLAGHENYKHTYDYMTGDRKNMFSYFGNQELDGATTYISNSSYKSEYCTEGWIFRALYDYDGKYFGQVSYRRDASSRFHPDHRWGNFYSFGGAWIVTKESWMKDVTWLNMLKLKASFGQNGNDNIDDFLYTDTYNINKGEGNEIGLTIKNIGNENITWETVTNVNAGFEFEVLHSRLRGGLDYFYRKTTDMLCTVRVPLSQGYAGYSSNIGDMVNKGVEIELEGEPIVTKDIKWTVGANLTAYKNKLVKLNEDNRYNTLEGGHPGYTSGSYYYGEGLPLYTWRLKKYAGVNANGESMWYMHDANGNLTTTTNPNDITSDNDYFNCGTALPDFYGGFNTSVSAYGFDFNISFAYSVGGKAMDWSYQSLMTVPTSGFTGRALHKDILNAWSTENPTSDIPRLQYGDEYSASTSDRFLTNASWLALQNVSLGYTFPKQWIRTLGLSNLRIYVSGENLTYWSHRKGFDPRISYAGSVSSDVTYAPARTVTAGISVQF